jgi:hypothetical protein
VPSPCLRSVSSEPAERIQATIKRRPAQRGGRPACASGGWRPHFSTERSGPSATCAERTDCAGGTATSPPPRAEIVARTEVVSWLRAASSAFPMPSGTSGALDLASCPLQWRGRAGISPASGSPARKIQLSIRIYGGPCPRASDEGAPGRHAYACANAPSIAAPIAVITSTK